MKDVEALFECYLNGTISSREMEQLNAILVSDKIARREFSEWLNVDSAIAAVAAGWSKSEDVEKSNVVSFPSKKNVRWAAVAACLVGMLGFLSWLTTDQDAGFATVEKAIGAPGFAVGAELRGEVFEIATGAVELRSARGAKIVIEAPAEFRFVNGQCLDLSRGRLAADVPPSAKGFTVVTPDGNAIDLGTRFGVDVPDSGKSEIHVFEGEVIAKGDGDNPEEKSLLSGDALRLEEKTGVARELRSAAFIHPDEMPSLTAGLIAGQRERSDEALRRLRGDPALIALIDFESSEPEGEYRMVQGRWPGSRAPEFVEVGDRMNLDVGGGRSFSQLTLAAWVRLDRLGAPYQSLLHTDGWSKNNPGQVHWMITSNTTMRLALQGNTLAAGAEEKQGYPDSSIPVLPERGRWVHLATVYDSEQQQVRFFLNGNFDKETRQEVAHPARLGAMQIGNWDLRDRKLSGRIDELILVGRAFSDEEVKELFESGNPYR